MKDLLEHIAAALAVYLPRLFAVIAAPRTNVLRLVREPRDPFAAGLSFVAITFAIAFVIQALLLPEGEDFATVAGVRFTTGLATMCAHAGALLLTFKMVGGTGSYSDTLVASFYIPAPPILGVVLLRAIALGLTRDAPELRTLMRSGGAVPEALTESFTRAAPGRALALLVVALAILLAPIGWFLVCWRIYRELHGLGPWRSALAYVVAFALFVVIARVQRTALLGSFSGAPPPWL